MTDPTSPPPSDTNTTTAPPLKSRKDRPCDACRRRKSRCVLNDGAEKCVLCEFHSQECTFVQSPQPRKRRPPDDDKPEKRRRSSTSAPASSSSSTKVIRESLPVTDYSHLDSSHLKETLGLQGNRHSHLVGLTGEYEAALIDLCPFDEADEYALPNGGSFRRISPATTFVLHPDSPTPNHADIYHDLDKIERIVAPHGDKLVKLYFRIVHPSFPILHKRVFLEKYARTHREFSPPLLAAVYILALHWWSYDRELSQAKKPDVEALEALASKTMADVVHRPKLSSVQAGLLLLQRTTEDGMKGSSWVLTAQLVAIGQELGLHLDCSDWKIPRWEKGLRKRLAWGLYMQDKWGALTHGRPSHIMKANWAVQPVCAEDFPEHSGERGEEEDGSAEVEKGRLLFSQMIGLTLIMSDVLETFFTVDSQTSCTSTPKVLEKAKPIQIRLKEWFTRLPDVLRMDSQPHKPRKLSSTGYLHLAYFATEITLHRQILRSLPTSATIDPYLLHICRSAAKTRLISAMDFVNRLKPEHLQSFWYFASKLHFALIATFGSLLWATSPIIAEAEFYKARLSEYRWTLRVSSRGAQFLDFAVRVLDAGAGHCQQESRRKREGAGRGEVGRGGGLLEFGLGMGVGLSRASGVEASETSRASGTSGTNTPGMNGTSTAGGPGEVGGGPWRSAVMGEMQDPGEGDEYDDDLMMDDASDVSGSTTGDVEEGEVVEDEGEGEGEHEGEHEGVEGGDFYIMPEVRSDE